MTRPFEGLKVIEFGRYVAGPYAAELLAHGGAIVTKVEEIEGDETRKNSEIVPGEGRQFIIKARGKRDLAIDLTAPAGLAAVRSLLASCDVVVSNMRPGVLDRLGLGYDEISPENPGVIYGEISGYGESGPNRDRASIDAVMQGVSGIMIGNRSMDEGRPVLSEAFVCDYMSAMTLAFGITVALRERDRTGLGQRVHTSLMDAALALQHGTASIFSAVDGWKEQLVEDARQGRIPRNEVIRRRREEFAGNRWFYNTYATADAHITIAGPGRHRKTILRILGVDDPQLSDPSWVMPDDPRPYLQEMYEKVAAAVATWTSAELLRTLEEAGVPCGPIRTLEEVLLDPATGEAGLVEHFDHPVVGPVLMPAAPVRFSALEYRAAHTSPSYGEHTEEVLREAGLPDDEIRSLVDQRVAGTPETSPFS